jgi:hypothetical protein
MTSKTEDSKNTLTLGDRARKPRGDANNPRKGATTTLGAAAGVTAEVIERGLHADEDQGTSPGTSDPSYPSLGALRDNGEGDNTGPTDYDVGEDVFDLIEDFGTKGQIVGWKAIAHSALASAMYSASFVIGRLERDSVDPGEPLDNDIVEAQYRTSLLSDLAVYAGLQCRALSDNEFDWPMTPAGLFDLMTSGEVQPDERGKAAHEAIMNTMDLSPEEKELARAERRTALLKQAKKNRDTMKARRDQILDEVSRGDARFVATRFDARQHLKFFQKVHEKLRNAARRALSYAGQYDDAEVDALEFSQLARRVDKAAAAFRRRNAGSLVQYEGNTAD